MRYPTTLTVNGQPAVEYEVRGNSASSKKALVILVAVVEGKDSFYTVMASTTLARLDKNKPIIQSIIQSIRPVEPPAVR